VRLARNLLIGLFGSAWTALLGLLVTPFFLHYLGIEAYGLIGFFITLQAVLSLLDMGLAPTINREVARGRAMNNLQDAGRLLHTLAWVYWIVAVLLGCLILLLAPWIAERWLQVKLLSPETVKQAVMLMGLIGACRWPIGLYTGVLLGAERLDLTTGITMVFSTIGSVGGIAILAWVSPTVSAFFVWQAVVGGVQVLVLRAVAWRTIGREDGIQFDFDRLRKVFRFSAGMSLIALTGVIFTQLDKLVLSKTLDLEGFGHYMLATAIAGSLYMLITPVYNVLYPRLSLLVAAGQTEQLINLYRQGTRAYTLILFSLTMFLAVFSQELVSLWLHNPGIAADVAPIVSVLVIGSGLHGIMFFPFALQLAHGTTRLPLLINSILMIALFPSIIFLSLRYGALGAAWAWLSLHVLYVLLGTWLTHRSLLRGLGWIWFSRDVGISLLVALIFGFSAYSVNRWLPWPDLARMALGTILTWGMMACSWKMLSEPIRAEIYAKLRHQ
jgi:O-antigen/teichoic acid export membrane protein